MPSTKPNRKFFSIIVWGLFLIILIAQIFWLGCEVQKLKSSVRYNEEINTINTRTINEIQDYLLNQIKKEHRSKFI